MSANDYVNIRERIDGYTEDKEFKMQVKMPQRRILNLTFLIKYTR
jgi:hypothetical protein